MQRRWFGRWNPLLVGMLAVLALGMGAWWGISRASLAFGAGPLSEDIQEKLATQILQLAGGEARGIARVTIEETGPAEWPQLHYIKLWLVRLDGLQQPGLVYASSDGTYLVSGTLIQANTLANLTQFRLQNVLPRYDLGRINFAQGHIRGTPEAPLRLVEFSDFQCPYCAKLQPVLDQLLQEYDGKLVHYFKHAPLASIHPRAQRLHEAAECASQQREEAFWTFHQRFFTTQTTEWDAETIRRTTAAWAEELQLDGAAFVGCVDQQATAGVVTGNLAEFPVSGTPTLLVGDEVVQGALPYEQVKAIIERKLRAMTGGGG
ncbi:MAG: thioredoxin domain-containing protein [Candidatus Entotheonellia bacterium]